MVIFMVFDKCNFYFVRLNSSPERLHRTLTQDEANDLIAWLKENSFLFDKSSEGFNIN